MTSTAIKLLLGAPVLLFAMVAHEYAHGYAALKQGDDTAYQLGRLSWNPLRHIDLWMTVILPISMWFMSDGRMALGGAKPVPVDPRKYRHYRRGDIIVSLAGIAANLGIAVVLVPAIIGIGFLGRWLPMTSDTLSLVQVMFAYGIYFNLLLAVFNLLPLPPLDGSHVLKHLLPTRLAIGYVRVSRYGFLILVAVLMFGSRVLSFWMTPAFWMNQFAVRLISPHILISPWTS